MYHFSYETMREPMEKMRVHELMFAGIFHNNKLQHQKVLILSKADAYCSNTAQGVFTMNNGWPLLRLRLSLF